MHDVAHFMLERLRAWDIHRVYGYPGDGKRQARRGQRAPAWRRQEVTSYPRGWRTVSRAASAVRRSVSTGAGLGPP
jgi:hypothetical protein